jgi:uncharacterized protein (TIGR00255 family)
MMRSMTAYAGVEVTTAFGRLSVELRSVNHRYLEFSLRLPEELRALEPRLRDRVAQRVGRGKVDAIVKRRTTDTAPVHLKLNQPLAAELARLAREVGQHAPDLVPGTRLEALAWPGMIVEPDEDQSALHDAALAVFDAALDEFIAAREREGARLRGFLAERLDGIEALVGSVRAMLPDIRSALRARLDQRLAALGQPLDPGRLEQEVVLNLSKIDIDEELDRLTAHVAEARRILGRPEPAGRRLDFLLQEFNREANTLGSKSVDQRSTQAAVELKVLIEQLREQVQNLE